ncbi:hypothetical protein SEA_CLOWN_17 [Gordonia phage Clown]|uniref:Uncharacterized protein n=1 Tax=Gordonia phage Clown TaxID=2759393 RepID=A0A7L7SU35_9CAUD|nr:hypothetical protein KNV25_gp17 [Gordonia phage Clown]QOC56015.1 hypothetical protein SEA_CLOWN_17 [Gordonia phage Clown]
MTAPADVTLASLHAVLRALHHATIKSPATGRSNGREYDVPKYLVHTRVQLAQNQAECDRLLAGAWDLLAIVLPAEDAAHVVNACDSYTRDLILTQREPVRTALAERLEHAVPTPGR